MPQSHFIFFKPCSLTRPECQSQVKCEALLSHLIPCVPLSCLSPVFAADLKFDIFHNLRLGRRGNTTKQAATAQPLFLGRHF